MSAPLNPSWLTDVGIALGCLGLIGFACGLIEGPPMTSRPWWELMVAFSAMIVGVMLVLIAVTP